MLALKTSIRSGVERSVNILQSTWHSLSLSPCQCALSAMCRYLSRSAARCQAGWLCSCPQSTWRHGQHQGGNIHYLPQSMHGACCSINEYYCAAFAILSAESESNAYCSIHFIYRGLVLGWCYAARQSTV